MSDTRSPIERMVDEACGTTPKQGHLLPAGAVNLRCPRCARQIRVAKDETDPEGTETVVSLCERCDDGGNKSVEVLYYDKDGKQVIPEWARENNMDGDPKAETDQEVENLRTLVKTLRNHISQLEDCSCDHARDDEGENAVCLRCAALNCIDQVLGKET